MKRFAWILVILLVVSLLLVGCRRGDSPASGIGKKVTGKLEFDDVDDLEQTDKEIKAFIKAFPVFKETAEKEGQKLDALSKKGLFGTMKGGKEALKVQKKFDKVLKPYGFTFEAFAMTLAKVMATYGYSMGLEAEKLAKDNIETMKKMLDNPMLSDEEKEEIRESIEELEKGEVSEEMKAFKKNAKVLKKYKDELEELFEEMQD